MKKLFTLTILAVCLTASWGCEKDEANEELSQAQLTLEETGPEMVGLAESGNEVFILTGQLAGVYEGFRNIKHESINCPNCELPCNFTYTYDTAFVEILVTYFSEDSITITDSFDGLFSRTIPIDSTLYYQGSPIHYQAPEGYLKMWFAGENNDSLIIDGFEGGGIPSCYGSFSYHDYHLVKQ